MTNMIRSFLGKYCYVIQVDDYNLVNQSTECDAHGPLKCGTSINKSNWHALESKISPLHPEGGFQSIWFCYLHLIISRESIQ